MAICLSVENIKGCQCAGFLLLVDIGASSRETKPRFHNYNSRFILRSYVSSQELRQSWRLHPSRQCWLQKAIENRLKMMIDPSVPPPGTTLSKLLRKAISQLKHITAFDEQMLEQLSTSTTEKEREDILALILYFFPDYILVTSHQNLNNLPSITVFSFSSE